MNRILVAALFAVVLLLFSTAVSAEVSTEEEAQEEITGEGGAFSGSTAIPMAPGRREVGLFGPLRYGLSENIEISAHPLWFFVAPNMRAKIALKNQAPLHISWSAGLSYPTLLLRLLSREGAGGIHPPNRAVPHIISIFNELIVTRNFDDHLVTGALGLQLAPRFGDSQMVSIDLPMVYPRTAAFFTAATIIPRAEAQGPIAGSFGYRAGIKGFIYPGADGSFAIEQYGQISWKWSLRWMVQAGYLFSYVGYPFGREADLLPLIDVTWSF